MANTKQFRELTKQARRDPQRVKRIEEAKARVLDEHASYRLAELRKALDVTQVELGELIGKSQSAVSQLETGEIGLSLEMLRSIATRLDGRVEISAAFEDRRVLLDA